MNAPRALLSLDDALARLVAAGQAHAIRGSEIVPTMESLGRVLREPVRSALDVPPADNASMDGYALRAADVRAPGTTLPLSQRIPAGVVGAPLAAGTAARIFTGAQVPAGADAVVMQEQCEAVAAAAGEGLGGVRVNTVPEPGQWIRRRGEDVREGSQVLGPGTRLTPQAMGLAATVGAATLSVVPRPRVALFSTGDELAMPGDALKPGSIYNSNRFTLAGLLRAAGCTVQDLGIVPDRLDATRDALRTAAEHSDLILTSGGVSVGEEDHLRPAVASLGTIEHWQIAIKPGKPLALGQVTRGERAGGSAALFVGLPGNPVSSFVTFLVCVAPVLRAMQGMAATLPTPVAVPAAFDWPRPDKRREFLRVRLNADGAAELFANQSSGVLTSTVWADGMADIPPGQAVRAGEPVAYRALSALVGS